MKYKILVNGKNSALVMDFIQHSGGYFKTLTTTEYWPDIVGHFELFDPDAYVCFVDFEFEKTLLQIGTLRNDPCYNGAAIIIIGDSATCDKIEEVSKYAANLMIRRPISQDNITLMMTRYFEDMEEANAKVRAEAEERQRQAAEQAKIDAAQRAAEERIAKAAQAAVAQAAQPAPETQSAETAQAAPPAQAAQPAQAAPAAQPAQPAGGRKHILVVDDDRTVLKMLKAALEDKYDVTTMANGIIVGKFLKTKKTDLIILDYEMPVETGADVFRKIKNDPETSHIPVCFLTGVTEREKVLEIMALKPHGYLVKPIDMDMLTATISNLTK